MRIVVVGADVLEGGVLLAIDEINRRRHVQLGHADSRRGMPDADQLLWVRIGQWLEEHALDHAEDRGISAYADGEREQGDRRK